MVDTLNIPYYNKTTLHRIFIYYLGLFLGNELRNIHTNTALYHLQQRAVAESLMEASAGRYISLQASNEEDRFLDAFALI